MKIIVIGGTGTIGQAVVQELSPRHELISIGHQSTKIKVDLGDAQSIKNMYEQIIKLENFKSGIDAVICTAGSVHFGELAKMTEKEYQIGLNHKLMGQVNLVLIGLNYINSKGSFTLTSGILNKDPILFGSSAAMVNGALEGFVKGASIEMPKNTRINIISPTVLTESLDHYQDYFRGFEPVSAEKVARAYSKSVEGLQTGNIYTVR